MKDFRAVEVRQARDAGQAACRVVIKKSDFEPLSEVAALLLEKCASLGFPLNARSDYAVQWYDDALLEMLRGKS